MRSKLADRLSRPGIRFRALPRASRIALCVLAAVILVSVFGPFFTLDPLQTGTAMLPPSAEHWFGTDRAGRDVFARIVYGGRYSLIIGLGATLVALVAGAALGALAATGRRWADEGVMRILDIVMAFPGIALAAVLIAVFGKGVPVLIVAIAVVYVPQLARVVRANVLEQYGEDYVAAEKVIGARRGFIIVRHVAINCAAPVMVFCTILVADAIVLEASLSFLGAGVQDPAPSWGNVLSYGRQILLSEGWWASFFAGLTVLVTIVALNVLAEGLTDTTSAPATGRDGDAEPGTTPAAASATGASAAGTEPGPAGESGHSAEEDIDAPLIRLAAQVRSWPRRVSALPEGAGELLAAEDLTIRFPGRSGDVRVIDGISFSVREGETLGLVGESGCGKSVTSLAVMGLLGRDAEISGRLAYRGEDLLTMPGKRRRALAGREIAMIYQDALSSLNPSILIGRQLRQLTSRGSDKTPSELLDMVGLAPERTLRSYPHELSGGQRQRVLIAMALSRNPRLLIADEPTTALDVTVQAQVVELLNELREELGFAMVLVSHDLALVSELAHRVAVMYAGQVAELGDLEALLSAPSHHYSRGLLGSVVSLEAGAGRLQSVPGVVPSPAEFGSGCRFASRCPAATQVCRTTKPELTGSDTHGSACHHPAVPAVFEGSTR